MKLRKKKFHNIIHTIIEFPFFVALVFPEKKKSKTPTEQRQCNHNNIYSRFSLPETQCNKNKSNGYKSPLPS